MHTLESLMRVCLLERSLGARHIVGGPCDKTLERGYNPCGPCDKTREDPPQTKCVYPGISIYGFVIDIFQMFPDGEIGVSAASVWKPPEERNETEKKSCPWQSPLALLI